MRKTTNYLMLLLALLVFGLMLILPAMAKGTMPPINTFNGSDYPGAPYGNGVCEVAALRAALARAWVRLDKKDAEINKFKYANTPPIAQQIKPAFADWKDAYGDTEITQLYFNAKSALVDVEQCKAAIRLIAAAMNTITDPNDPNSLAARVEVLEEVAEDFDKFFSYTLRSGAPYEEAVRFDYYALKEDDPNEVAR